MKLRLSLIALLLICLCTTSAAQARLEWSVDFGTVFDNREGDNDYRRAETIFFTQLRPLAGIRLGRHDSFMGGVDWIEPVGYDWEGTRVRPVLFYRHSTDRWSGSFGVFPRTQLFEEMPSFMWGDSTAYFQPEIRGALLQWRGGRSFAELYVDWRQKQTVSKRESFTIAGHGRWQAPGGPWMAGGYITMNHLALTKNAPENMHIVDNFLAAPYIGADFSDGTALDSLRVRAGAAITVERNRAEGNWRYPAGGWLELIIGYKGFRLKNMLYAGGRLLPSFGLFGAELYQGDPFYGPRFYDGAELSYGIIQKKWGQLRAELDFNFSPHSFIFYQKITLAIRFGQSYKLSSRNSF